MKKVNNMCFVHDFYFSRLNETVYGANQFSYETLWMKKYLPYTKNLTVISRESTYNKNNSAILSGPNINFVGTKNMACLKILFNYFYNKKKMKKVLLDSDLTFVRLPSLQGLLASRILRKNNKKYIVEVVGNAFDSYYYHDKVKGKIFAPFVQFLTKREIKKAQNVIYVTNEYLQKVYPNKHNVIFASDVSIDSENITKKYLIEKHNSFNNKKIIIGLCGPLDVLYKGHEVALKLIKELNKSVDAEIHFLGSGDKNYWINYSKKLGVEDKVVFDNPKNSYSEMKDWYKSLDFLIMPSKTEGLPRVCVEAMSMGIPVISSTVGELPFLLDSRDVFNYKNYKGMTNRILYLINNQSQYVDNIISNLDKCKLFNKKVLFDKRESFILKVINCKKVVITNGWSDLNSGDSAIVMSLIKKIYEKNEYCDISVFSELNVNNEFYLTSIDKIKEMFPDIKLYSSPFYKKYKSNIVDKMFELISFVYNVILMKLPKVIFNIFEGNKDYVKIIKEADVVISKGGHFLYEFEGIHGYVHIKKCVHPLVVAKKYNKNYYIISQSIGPFYNKGFYSKLIYNNTYKVLSNAKKVSIREDVSFDYLEKNGFNMNNICRTSDLAFELPAHEFSDEVELNNIISKGKFVVITMRQYDFKNKDVGKNNYYSLIDKLATEIANKYNYNIVFVPHVQGPNPFENDKITVEEFKNKYSNNSKYIFTSGYYNAGILKKLYSNAEVLIGTRFHSVIFALGSLVPSLAISYAGFKASIIKQSGLGKFLIDINDVNLDNYDFILNLVEELISNRDKYSNLIKKNMKNINSFINNDEALVEVLQSIGDNYE